MADDVFSAEELMQAYERMKAMEKDIKAMRAQRDAQWQAAYMRRRKWAIQRRRHNKGKLG